MTEFDLDPQEPYVEWIVREARRPVELAGGARARIMDAVRATPLPARPRRGTRWLTSPRPLALSPIASTLLAAGLVGIGVLTGLAVTHRDGRQAVEQPTAVAANAQLPASSAAVVHEFVLQAPQASHVSLVGDFNGWSNAATPMQRTDDGKWIVKVKLPAGRHVYAFEVDGAGGTKFMPDPAALRAPDDGLGPSSVVLVGQGSAT
jgi:hypothetical protein